MCFFFLTVSADLEFYTQRTLTKLNDCDGEALQSVWVCH